MGPIDAFFRPIVVHNNYVIGKAKKMQRFRDFRVWLLTKVFLTNSANPNPVLL